jgi:hypothetical protein
MIRAVVDPGICGMKTAVEVHRTGKLRVRVEIHSECEKVAGMAASMSDLALREVLRPHIASDVYKNASARSLCASCPVPSGVLKAIEIESGLALPKPVRIDFEAVK